tara:strand:- start:123 stop:338 length:216 start_codon:yes stop_codon:yes gene_type:complete
MNLERYKTLKNDIEILSKEEKIEVFKIIKNHNLFYTQNNNGIFIILNKLDNTVIDEMDHFLLFLNKTKDIL